MNNEEKMAQSRKRLLQNKTKNFLTQQKINTFFQQYKQNDCPLIGIQKVFQIIEVSNGLKGDPQNPIIRQNLQEKFQTSQEEILKLKQQNQNFIAIFKFDIEKTFMMNKSGSIGMIQRKCKLTEKGVLQFQDQKWLPKLKQIIGFKNLIQILASKTKTNYSKLPWLKGSSDYGFRIVLIDKNKAQKGIYFKTLQEAISARIYLIHQYKLKLKKQRVTQILVTSQNELQEKVSQDFLQKLLHWKKFNVRSQKSLTQKGGPLSKSQIKSNKEIKLFDNLNKQPNLITQSNNKFHHGILQLDRDSHPLSQYQFGEKNNYYEDSKTQIGFKKASKNTIFSRKQFIQEQNEKKSLKNKILPAGLAEKLKRYNHGNIIDFAQSWIQRISQEQNGNLLKIRSQESFKKQITQETELQSIIDCLRRQQNEQKEISLLQKAKSRQNITLSFDSLSMQVNSFQSLPIKLQLQVDVFSQRGKCMHFKFTTFQSINKNNHIKIKEYQQADLNQQKNRLVYDLVRVNENQETIFEIMNDKIQLREKISSYKIIMKLKEILTQNVIGQKEFLLKNVKTFCGRFDICLETSVKTFKGQQSMNNRNSLQNGRRQIKFNVSGFLSKLKANNKDTIKKQEQNLLLSSKNSKQKLQLVRKMLFFLESKSEKNYNLQNETVSQNQVNVNQNDFKKDWIFLDRRLSLLPELQQTVQQAIKQTLRQQQLSVRNQDGGQTIKNGNNLFKSDNLINCRNVSLNTTKRQLVNEQQLWEVMGLGEQILRNAGYRDPLISECHVHELIMRQLICSELFLTKQELLQQFVSLVLSIQKATTFHIDRNTSNSTSKAQMNKDEGIRYVQDKLMMGLLVEYLLEKQCHQVYKLCLRRGIPIVMIVAQYCHKMGCQLLQGKLWLHVIVQILLQELGHTRYDTPTSAAIDIHKQTSKIQIKLIFVVVYVLNLASSQGNFTSEYSTDIQSLTDLQMLMQSQLNNIQDLYRHDPRRLQLVSSAIMSFLNQKYMHYFCQPQQSSPSKQQFHQNPSSSTNQQLQQLLNNFYTLQSQQLKCQSSNRHQQKMAITKSILQIIEKHVRTNGHNLLEALFLMNQKYSSNLITGYQQLTSQSLALRFNHQQNTNDVKYRYLHICFVTLPKVSGSLYIKTQSSEFECTQYETNPYFILSLNSQTRTTKTVTVQFIDSKSNEYQFEPQLTFGFSRYKNEVKTSKSMAPIVFQYWAGLVEVMNSDDNTTNMSTKQLEQMLTSFITLDEVKMKLQREPKQSVVYQTLQHALLSAATSNKNTQLHTQNKDKSSPLSFMLSPNNAQNKQNTLSISQQAAHEILKKVKTIFCSQIDSRKINQYELYSYLLLNRKVTLKEKVFSLIQYADHLAAQILLSRGNEGLRKMLVYEFLGKMMGGTLDRMEFQSIYQGLSQFKLNRNLLPRVLRAFCVLTLHNFYNNNQNGNNQHKNEQRTQNQQSGQSIQINLQRQLYEYLQQRLSKYVYCDIAVDEFVAKYMKPAIAQELRHMNKGRQKNARYDPIQGRLAITVSSQSELRTFAYKILVQQNHGSINQFVIKVDHDVARNKHNNSEYIGYNDISDQQQLLKLSTLKPKLLNNNKTTQSKQRTSIPSIVSKNLMTSTPTKSQTKKANSIIQLPSNSRFNSSYTVSNPLSSIKLIKTVEKQPLPYVSNNKLTIKQDLPASRTNLPIISNQNKSQLQLISQLIDNQSFSNLKFQEQNLLQYITQNHNKIITLRSTKMPQSQQNSSDISSLLSLCDLSYFEHFNCHLVKLTIENHQLSSIIQQLYFDNQLQHNLLFLLQLKSQLKSKNIKLHFYSDINGGEMMEYDFEIGFYNNIHKLISTAITNLDNKTQNKLPTKVYFVTRKTDSKLRNNQYSRLNSIIKTDSQSKVMINYGQGIIRWQKCWILGYFLLKRQKQHKKNKKIYLICLRQGQYKLTEQKHLKITLSQYQKLAKGVRYLGLISEKNMKTWQRYQLL